MGTENTSEQERSEEREGQPGREEKQSVQGYVAIKGTRNGLLLTLEPETPFSELLTALSDRLAEAPSFFRGASLSIDTTRRMLKVNERTQLEKLLEHYQMSVMPLEQASAATRKIGENNGERLYSVSKPFSTVEAIETSVSASNIVPALADPRDSENILFLRRTVRSGQAVHHPGTIVVLGDVNPGAEVVAGGDVIIWGVLRGVVHAGYPENENAYVCALQLAPVQLRIARLLSRPPDGMNVQSHPEVATIRNERIVVETWVNGRPPRKL